MRLELSDLFGRPQCLTQIHRIGQIGLALITVITGSVWPSPARSVTSPLDSKWQFFPRSIPV